MAMMAMTTKSSIRVNPANPPEPPALKSDRFIMRLSFCERTPPGLYLFSVGHASLPAGSGGIPATRGALRAGMPGEPGSQDGCPTRARETLNTYPGLLG